MNNYLKLICTTIRKTFTLAGRADRREFNIFHMFYFCTMFVTYNTIPYLETRSLIVVSFLVLLYFVLLFVALPPILSLFVRRLHDLNASGWWLLITFIPFGAILFFALPFKKGTQGANRYGEQPKN